jgi:hypothetical protein
MNKDIINKKNYFKGSARAVSVSNVDRQCTFPNPELGYCGFVDNNYGVSLTLTCKVK